MNAFFKNLLLLTIVIALTLLMMEGLTRLFYPQQMSGLIKSLSNWGYTLNRSHGTALIEQGTSRKILYHFYPPALRGTPVNPNATHIVTLGDSVTFGWLQPFEKTYVYLLQQSLDKKFGKNQFQLLNAASGGWGAAEYLAYLKQFGAALHPKYVLVFIDSDDIGRAVALNIFKLKNLHTYTLINHFHPYPHAVIKSFLDNSHVYHFLLMHSELVQLIRNVFLHQASNARTVQAYMDSEQHLHHIAPVFSRNDETTIQLRYAVALGNAIFYQINQWCIAHHAKLLVVTTGYNAFYMPHANDPTQAFLKQAPAFFKKQHIAYDDIAPEFKKAVTGRPFQLPGDVHPNDFGDQTIANLVWPWLVKQLQWPNVSIKTPAKQ